jgi:hypothetical protein
MKTGEVVVTIVASPSVNTIPAQEGGICGVGRRVEQGEGAKANKPFSSHHRVISTPRVDFTLLPNPARS